MVKEIRMKEAMPSVLLVDDSPKNVDLLVNTLKNDYCLGIARSGPKALDYAEKHHPDLILLDIMMPEMDGFEVCSRLKAAPETKDIPVVFLTAMSETDDKTRGFEMGAVDYITKPFRPAEVKARVRAHLTLKEMREKIQQQALQSMELFHQGQKIEAMGTLAGGIAHHFNNLLMGIQGRASLMLIDIDPSHLFYGHLKKIEEHVISAADLTKQLLGLAGKGKYEVRSTDLNELIKKTSRMFGRTEKEIKIHCRFQEDLWAVEIDQEQIEQVMMNLYVNAWQAMPGSGDLNLETQNTKLDKNFSKLFSVEEGKYVKISVTDNGIGMDEATRQRVFEPFYTTKAMGRGAGLGLASAYGIIKNHDGIINVYSEKGEGTTFNIYLPASDKRVSGKKESTGEIIEGTEMILFVDDEDMIVHVGKQILNRLGYKVIIAKGGQEAIELYKENQEKIDMVILDMIMPDVGGKMAYEKLKEINPGIKVLLSSGYSVTGQAQEILDKGCNGFIQKPFNLKDLSLKLREILD
jgi:CheY-like chemotaxis protein